MLVNGNGRLITQPRRRRHQLELGSGREIDAGDLSGSTLALGAIYFSFQIYCDFSGYSDIAIGSAKLFGIRLRDNKPALFNS